jgi:acetyl-CoA acetyltransferase
VERDDRDSSAVGMHPWGKWGRNFVEYGVVAAQAALADAGVEWRDIQFVRAARPSATGTRVCRGRDVRAGARLERRAGRVVVRACASGATALAAARAQILAGFCDVAMVIGADTTPEGFPRAQQGRARRRPRLAALPAARRDQPDVLRLYARRRMELFGATR